MEDSLKEEIKSTCLISGDFTLRSGIKSPVYFDKYRFESNPLLLYSVCSRMVDNWNFFNIDCVAGLETGGIPLSVMVSYIISSREIVTPSVFVRKKPKDYGTCSFVEGMDVSNKKLLVIEDVITTGGQVLESCKMLESVGATIFGIQCVLIRDKKALSLVGNKYNLKYLFDFSDEI